MVTRYSSKIAIADTCTAVSNISRTWKECWNGLMKGDAIFEHGDEISVKWPQTVALSMLGERAGWKTQPPYQERFKMIMRMVGEDMRGLVDKMAERNPGLRMRAIIATCHSDPGALSTLTDYKAGVRDSYPEDSWNKLLRSSFPQYLAEGLGRTLPVSIVSSACASTLVAVSYGSDMMNAGLCDAVLVVALDGMARVATAGFHNIGAMTKSVCMPYDVKRTGTTVGEGGVGFMMAKEEFLLPEEIYGHVAGTSIYCDAAHIVEPNLGGVQSVLQVAMDQAGVAASEIAGIYWHGTGTKHNDKVEAEVSEILFGEKSPPCSSTKGSLGHTMGASGGYNILAACESNKSGKMLQVTSLTELEYPNLDVVQNSPRDIAPGPILVTALGFGGINAAVVVAP